MGKITNEWLSSVKTLIEGRFIIAVDFDGTITTEGSMGEGMQLRPDCKRVLTRLKEAGVDLILWTCRTDEYYEKALEFLKEHEMLDLFVAFNEQTKEAREKFQADARKIGADMYIDDKSYPWLTVNWNEIEHVLFDVLHVERFIQATSVI